MASVDSLNSRAIAARGAIVVTRDDTPIMLRMHYIGTTSVTSVTPTTATNLVTVTTESGATVTKTYTFATYTTVGALADAINADGIFEVKVLDGLRSDLTTASNIVENAAITAGADENGVVVYDIHYDNSVNKFISSALSLNRNFNVGKNFKLGHRVHLQEIVYYEDVNGASANAVRVYYRNGLTETQVMGFASVDVTKTTINFASGVGKLTAPEGADIIVRVQDATSLTDGTSNFLQVTGILE